MIFIKLLILSLSISGNSDEHTSKVSEPDSDTSFSLDKRGNKHDESKQISSKSEVISTRNGTEKTDDGAEASEKSTRKVSIKNGTDKTDDRAITGEKLGKKASPSPERGRKRTHSREHLKHSEQYELAKKRKKEIEEILKNDGQNNEDKIEADKTLEEKVNSKNEKKECKKSTKMRR